MKIDPEYRKRIEQIKIDGENYADLAMRDVYSEQSAALDELHKTIGKIYIDHAKAGFLTLSGTEKAQITANMKAYLKSMGSKLGDNEVKKVTDILENVFKDTYYKNIYTLESGMTVNLKFNILKKEFVAAAVNQKYKGEMFSDRIWSNKADMIDKLQSSIIGAMKGDTTIDKIGRQIRDTFNVGAYESQRLVQTETARVQTQAGDDMARDTGIEQQMWSATLESQTCSECASLDGKTFSIDEAPDCPDHPECRCCLINVPYAGWSPTARRDNETKEIINYENYDDWAKDKGINNSDKDDTNSDNSGIISLEDGFRNKIQSGEYELTVNQNLQDRHDPDSDGYIEGRSKLAEDAQSLINKYHGTGRIVVQSPSQPPKEVITADTIIGQYRDPDTGKWIDTHTGMIVYSKSGTHVYPIKEANDDD